jgi:hypothetical protein
MAAGVVAEGFVFGEAVVVFVGCLFGWFLS